MPNPQLKQELSGKERFASILIILQDRLIPISPSRRSKSKAPAKYHPRQELLFSNSEQCEPFASFLQHKEIQEGPNANTAGTSHTVWPLADKTPAAVALQYDCVPYQGFSPQLQYMETRAYLPKIAAVFSVRAKPTSSWRYTSQAASESKSEVQVPIWRRKALSKGKIQGHLPVQLTRDCWALLGFFFTRLTLIPEQWDQLASLVIGLMVTVTFCARHQRHTLCSRVCHKRVFGPIIHFHPTPCLGKK